VFAGDGDRARMVTVAEGGYLLGMVTRRVGTR